MYLKMRSLAEDILRQYGQLMSHDLLEDGDRIGLPPSSPAKSVIVRYSRSSTISV